MNEFLLLFIIIIVSIGLTNILSNILLPPNQEGFTTYFRQTIRPRMRYFRDAHNTITGHFTTKFTDFGRRLGFV